MTTSCQEALARSTVYELLSVAFLYPQQGAAAFLAEKARRAAWAASEETLPKVRKSLEEVTSRLVPAPDDATLLEEYIEVFGHTGSPDCSPYEGEYGQAHIFQKSQALADLGTFYAAFGVTPSPTLKDRPDHVSVEMEFMHLLTLKEAYAQIRQHGEDKVLLCHMAQQVFLAHHLSNWIHSFACRLETKATADGAYGSLARLLKAFMDYEFEAFRLSASPGVPVAETVPPEAEQECSTCPLVLEEASTGGVP